MKYTIEKQDKYISFTMHESKIDSVLAPDLKSELLKQQANGVGNIILNLSEVKYMDSSGLSALLVGNRIFNNNGGLFILVNPSKHVKKLMQISQLDTFLNIFPTTGQAVEKINKHVAT